MRRLAVGARDLREADFSPASRWGHVSGMQVVQQLARACGPEHAGALGAGRAGAQGKILGPSIELPSHCGSELDNNCGENCVNILLVILRFKSVGCRGKLIRVWTKAR